MFSPLTPLFAFAFDFLLSLLLAIAFRFSFRRRRAMSAMLDYAAAADVASHAIVTIVVVLPFH